jgi:hypothetical protein
LASKLRRPAEFLPGGFDHNGRVVQFCQPLELTLKPLPAFSQRAEQILQTLAFDRNLVFQPSDRVVARGETFTNRTDYHHPTTVRLASRHSTKVVWCLLASVDYDSERAKDQGFGEDVSHTLSHFVVFGSSLLQAPV